MDIIETMKKRQSVRDFSEQPISAEHYKIILEAAIMLQSEERPITL
jgi:nitroreductase